MIIITHRRRARAAASRHAAGGPVGVFGQDVCEDTDGETATDGDGAGSEPAQKAYALRRADTDTDDDSDADGPRSRRADPRWSGYPLSQRYPGTELVRK